MLRHLHTLSGKDVNAVGGKAANLGELCSLGLDVPKGFVIPASVRDKFIRGRLDVYDSVESGVGGLAEVSPTVRYESLLEAQLDPELEESLYEFYENLELYLVSVRNSATVEDSKNFSFAGIFESYLNIDKQDLSEAIKKCWSSVYSKRAQEYIGKQNVQIHEIGMAVIVQEMASPDVSGICFTANPITGNHNEYYIEAALGIGEAIVSGKVTPDGYLYDWSRQIIVEKNINLQHSKTVIDGTDVKQVEIPEEHRGIQKLDDHVIKDLVDKCHKIAAHFGMPQDIEFAVKNDVIHFLQSRPITTL